jgi:hypothetical protein
MRNHSRHLPALYLFGSPSHYNPLLSLFLNIILFLDGSQLQNHNLSALIRAYIMTYPRRDTTLAHQQKLRTTPAGRTGGHARSASIKSTATTSDTSDEREMLALSPLISAFEEIKSFNEKLQEHLEGTGPKKTSNAVWPLAQFLEYLVNNSLLVLPTHHSWNARPGGLPSHLKTWGEAIFEGLIHEDMLVRNALKIEKKAKEKRGTQWTWNTCEEVQKMLAEID